MRRSKFFILFFLVLAFPLTLLARDIDSIVARIQEKYEKVSTLSARFVQETYIKTLDKREFAEGRVYFQKPGKMRWDYTAPAGDEVVSDGLTLWVYESELAQVIETPARTATASVAMDFLTGSGDLKNDFSVTLIDEKARSFLLGLEPKAALDGIKRISIEVDKGNYLVVKSVIYDHFGGETSISLADIEPNAALKGSLFEFSVPQGVRVSTVNMQEVDNAVNQALKEIRQRYDFKGSKSEIRWDRKGEITVIGDDDFKLKSVIDILQTRLVRRGVSHRGDEKTTDNGPPGYRTG
jgi:chaperone LolA